MENFSNIVVLNAIQKSIDLLAEILITMCRYLFQEVFDDFDGANDDAIAIVGFIIFQYFPPEGIPPLKKFGSLAKMRKFAVHISPDGGIGRRAGLKIQYPLKMCGFDSRSGH